MRLLGLVISVGLADSMNPSTIAPALYLATGECSKRDLVQFILGTGGVYLVQGRAFLQRRWPLLLAVLALLAGAFVTILGITGIVGRGHGAAAGVSRRLRHLITEG